MSFAGMLTTAGEVWKSTLATDAIGGQTETWAKHADVRCLVQARRATERAMFGQTGVEITHKGFLPSGTSIDEADQLRVGSTVYEVAFVNDVRGHHLELDLVERRPTR